MGRDADCGARKRGACRVNSGSSQELDKVE